MVVSIEALPQASPVRGRRSFREALPIAVETLLFMMRNSGAVSRVALGNAMTEAFGGSDSSGYWNWKDAYDLLEVATVAYVREYLQYASKTKRPEEILAHFIDFTKALPTQTIRSVEGQALQQFSTPLPMAYIAYRAAGITKNHLVLEPSAGTGLLAVGADVDEARLILNEISPRRSQILKWLFKASEHYAVNAEYIDDLLPYEKTPQVVLMNPPFSTSPRFQSKSMEVTQRHIGSAFARLSPGGRLVAITGHSFAPRSSRWQSVFTGWQKTGTVRLSLPLAGDLYSKHGTHFGTRLTVIDKVPAENPEVFPEETNEIFDLQVLLQRIEELPKLQLPAGAKKAEKAARVVNIAPVFEDLPLFQYAPTVLKPKPAVVLPLVPTPAGFEDVIEVKFTPKEWKPRRDGIERTLYEPYEPQAIEIEGACPHPTPLVESTAMASVAPPVPKYRPKLPKRVVTEGILSCTQIESAIYAGEAHSSFLGGTLSPDKSLDFLVHDPDGFRYRRGWSLGDGTGVGKGRQVAGIILDNWLQGRQRAIWVSASDKLIEDARRDWEALGGSKEDIVSLSDFRQGTEIDLTRGIIFATYATLRVGSRNGKISRVEQLINWCGKDFDGCIVFDEAHMLRNAAAEKGDRGIKKASLQGVAGLRLQNALPSARVVYVSATGATEVHNLAYAQRLGLWQTTEFPFKSQAAFVAEMEAGGIAALEVVTQDLKRLGLYASRTLSFEGVEYEMLEHELTEPQREIYDAYAKAYQIIYRGIHSALEAANVTSKKGGTLNSHSKSAAMSAFESCKQRFFGHLLNSMKCPSLIPAIEQDLKDGHSVVIQVVSTNEAVMERRLAGLPPSEWSDLHFDITPREYVMDYLAHAFPVALHEAYQTDKGEIRSNMMTDEEGNAIACREAVQIRYELIQHISLLPPLPGALDQIIHHFGHDKVAEVTGRSRRIVKVVENGSERMCVQNRPASSNLAEGAAFQSGEKRILIFSEAGGIGRSYHADLSCGNQSRRIHYLLESGWRADNALQGLGRTNRTNQAVPPVFRPVTTDVKGEKRFVSTIARRLDSLGALTRGQRQTGGQGLFREQDNLESPYARAALRRLFLAIQRGTLPFSSPATFESMTGLSLVDNDGRLREDLPPMPKFLNRILALELSLQNQLFDELEVRIESAIEDAIASGTYEVGVETLKADSITVVDRKDIYKHPASGAITTCIKLEKRVRTKVLSLEGALDLAERSEGQLLQNSRSGNVCVAVKSTGYVDDKGAIVQRLALIRPASKERMSLEDLRRSAWQKIDRAAFEAAWTYEITQLPEFEVSTLYLMSGLLLPIWDKLPRSNVRVYRLQTDEGERIIGRLVLPQELSIVYRNLNVALEAKMDSREIVHSVLERRESVKVGKWRAHSAYVMGSRRIELAGTFSREDVSRLQALGCYVEMIQWRTRVFVPIEGAASVIDRVLLAS